MLVATPIRRGAGGPTTAAGKARSARNALKHGLDRPAARDPAFADEIAALAAALAGETAPAPVRAAALAVAAAEVQLRRIRRARAALHRRATQPTAPAAGALIRAFTDLQSGAESDAGLVAAGRRGVGDPWSDPDAGARLIRQLHALERYEQRATSSRRKALRALDAAVAAARLPEAAGSDGRPLAASQAPVPAVPDAARAVSAERTPPPDARRAGGGHAGAGGAPAPDAGAPPVDPTANLAERTPCIAPVDPHRGPARGACGPPAGVERFGDASEFVVQLAFAGVPPERIARRLNLSLEELDARYGHALEAGPDAMQAEVAYALFQAAIGGDVRCGIFILKCRGGWRDTGPARGPPGPTRGPQSPTPAEKRELVAKVMQMIERRAPGAEEP